MNPHPAENPTRAPDQGIVTVNPNPPADPIIGQPPVPPVGPLQPGLPRSFDPPGPTKIIKPTWVRVPGPKEFSKYYPAAAAEAGLGGTVNLRCTVAANGSVGVPGAGRAASAFSSAATAAVTSAA